MTQYRILSNTFYLGLPGSTWVYLGSSRVYPGLPGSTWVYLGLTGSTWVYLGLPGPMTQYSIQSHNKLLSIEYWVIKDTESLYCNISTLCIVMFEQYHRIFRASGCCAGRTLVVGFADSHGQSTRLTIILYRQHVVVIIMIVIINTIINIM